MVANASKKAIIRYARSVETGIKLARFRGNCIKKKKKKKKIRRHPQGIKKQRNKREQTKIPNKMKKRKKDQAKGQ